MSLDVMNNDQVEVAATVDVPRELIDAGVFYGRPKSRMNPKMKDYVATNRNGIEIINVLKTLEDLERALVFLKGKVQEGSLVLFVGTQPAAQDLVAGIASRFGMPFVTRRWLGGTLTNFKVISKRVELFKKLKSDLASGALEKYTKRERAKMLDESQKLEGLLGGLETLSRVPDVVIIIDPLLHETAVREARRLRVPAIAFANVDADPDEVQFPVVGNNAARRSIAWFLGCVEKAIAEGIALRPVATAREAQKEEKQDSSERA